MAGDWIKWIKGLTRKREVIAVARKLNLHRRIVACLCMEMWEWADSETGDGHVRGATADVIDDLVGQPGFAACLADSEVGWLRVTEAGITFPNFERHNGESAKARALDAERKRMSRSCPKNVRQMSAESPPPSSLLSSSLDPPSVEGVQGETAPAPPVDFAAFWRVCPRRVGKGQAERAWAAAVKQAPPEIIVEAMTEYGGAMAEMGTDPKYIRHPATWLHGRGWTDDRAEWWGRDTAKREAWRRKRAALEWWGTLSTQEQNATIESLMVIIRQRDEWDPVRQAWERDRAAGRVERFAVEAHKRKGMS